ncbi:MAG: hypothetical protein QM572_11585, partial [Nocardioides sp.]|uniref:hypothetical protein n=1 Tax=Nocardioides sp. TaxID=35761 RepID=UPI0039E299CE
MAGTPWFLRSRRLRVAAATALVLDLGAGAFAAALAVSSVSSVSVMTADTATTSSAVTVAWTDGRKALDPDYVDDTTLDASDPNQPLFKDLAVTVSQTADLTDQGLLVSWTGGKATSAGGAASNYLQIMQCWASSDTGPTPQQCQWGTPSSSVASQTGSYASTRDLMTGDEADPKQDLGADYLHGQFGNEATNTVPFWSIEDPGKTSLTWTNDQYNLPPFNAAQSNEVTYARTGADGTGRAIVSLQSALSAPYLGCGDATYAAQGKSCWLVVVPRGEYNPNGRKASEHDDSLPQNYSYVAGSPLTASVWQDRIQVKLGFSAVGGNCKLGATEIPTSGSELARDAALSWKSSMCAKGLTFGFSKVSDGQARSAITSSVSGGATLDYVTEPVDPDSVNGATLAYAPVTTSAIVVSYLIDKAYTSSSANPDLGSNGTLVTDLRLTPRLVAKLLTQSYRADTPGDGANSEVASTNPLSLRNDPEFLALNPNFAYFYNTSGPDGLIVPFGDSDAAKAVWSWLRSDSAARKFLAGKADPWGMTINPAYLDLDLDTDTTLASFPKADPSQFQTGDAPAPGYGTIDMRPYSSDYTDGAKRTVTATAGGKTFWDVTKVPAQYTGGAAQLPGSRFELAITTSQAASLYGLPVASLVDDVNDTGDGVSPTISAMTAQLAARVDSDVAGVTTMNALKSVEGGYPLTLQTYAVVNVCTASLSDLKAYASYLEYVGTSGQSSGQKLGELPLGYAPLDDTDKAADLSVAAELRAEVASPACDSHKKATTTKASASASASASAAAATTPAA